jgi:YD repeat-containing protein
VSTDVLILNHQQRKMSSTLALHGLKLGVDQTTGQDAQAIIANPNTGNNQVIASGNLTLTTGTFVGTHSGDGSALTSLNATQLTTGTVPLARITGLTNTQIAAGAGIVYSKLTLTGSIVDADVAAGAAIADTKLGTIATALKVSNSATTANASNVNNAIVARDGSGNFSCTQITVSGDPTTALQVATKQYVDNALFGLDLKPSVKARTTANLAATRSGNVLTATANGVLAAQDGYTPAVNDRLLVMNQTTGADNGIYDVTSVGAAGAPYVLTRSSDFDNSPTGEVTAGAYTYIEFGTLYATTQWALITTGTINLNVTSLSFTQLTGAGSVVAGAGLTQTGNTIDVVAGDSTITVSANDIKVGATSLTDAHINAAAAIGWTKISKTGSSFADFTTRSATDINSGTLADARLSANVPLLNAATNSFTGAVAIGTTTAGSAPTNYVGSSANNNMFVDATAGTVLNSGNNFIINIDSDNNATGTTFKIRHNTNSTTGGADLFTVDDSGLVTATTFSGSGASLTALNGSNISTGTVADARLSSNVDLLNAAQTFTAKKTFTTSVAGNASFTVPHGVAPTSPVDGDVWTTSAGGIFVRINGATQNLAQLGSNTFTGIQILPAGTTGSASMRIVPGVAPTTPTNGDMWTTATNLHVRIAGTTQNLASEAFSSNASNLSSGTVADARLSANIPLKNGNNIYTGTATFQDDVAMGNDNQDVMEIQSLYVETDTRSETVTYNGDGTVNVITEKDGVTTVRTTTFAYNGSGQVTTKTVVANGKTATTTYSYTGNEITSTSRTVV